MFPLYDASKPLSYKPFVTFFLIIINIFCFSITFNNNLSSNIFKFGFTPYLFFHKLKFETIFSSMFLHGSFWHLFANMWFLWIFGPSLEKKLGRLRFLFFYLVSGVAAALFYSFFNFNSKIPLIGASGAISGILGGYFRVFPRNKIVTLIPIFFFIDIVEIPAFLFGIFWFFYQFLYFGFESSLGIAFSAHIGGFLFGAFSVKLFLPKRKIIFLS